MFTVHTFLLSWFAAWEWWAVMFSTLIWFDSAYSSNSNWKFLLVVINIIKISMFLHLLASEAYQLWNNNSFNWFFLWPVQFVYILLHGKGGQHELLKNERLFVWKQLVWTFTWLAEDFSSFDHKYSNADFLSWIWSDGAAFRDTAKSELVCSNLEKRDNGDISLKYI